MQLRHATPFLFCLSFSCSFTQTPARGEAPDPALPPPTRANVAYGTHARQVLDFWQAKSDRPTPLVFFIHGGGWAGGDKSKVAQIAPLETFLNAGISIVAINYRYVPQAIAAGVQPPVQWPLHDAARALQFVRSRAAEWNIDPARIGASGGSAGACSSLWLAFHEDLADPASPDPVARQSTRLFCAAVRDAQTTLDPKLMHEWTPNSVYGGHAFGFMSNPGDNRTRDAQFSAFLAARDRLLPLIRQYSPMDWVTPDDPPVYLAYTAAPALGQPQDDPTHSANFGVQLQEVMRRAGVPCDLVYPGAPDIVYPNVRDYLLAKLRRP
ncbi:MAG: alpha/beta hydrolase [Opitutaceae bacterium]|nr:alpha/beta hydrolase [Opitutaceae bacterium]